ncbi:MAG: DUF2183 domain-containing protein [Azoarcus sp.]|jgi:hypothetical protein|nr:DUF2183 domain-containing protein [Azoarcus sp.]
MTSIKTLLVFFFSVFGALTASAAGSGLKADERVMFFPGLAVQQADGTFMVPIEAWVFEEEPRRVAAFALASWMGIDLDACTPTQKERFMERTRYFRTDSERGKTLTVRLNKQTTFTLPDTNSSGRASGQLKVGHDAFHWYKGPDGFGRVDWTLQAPGHPSHGEKGSAQAISAEGVSIVSDIDDTIKISEVRDRKALLRNTFIEPFRAVPGMAAWYKELAGNYWPSVVFHYLSAAPAQMYPALSEFLREEGFSAGILHLRESTSWRTLYANHEETVAHKKNILIRLITGWPQRKFILIGDSGEKDPEIYADIARAYPDRILAIHIRDVTHEPRDAPRYQHTFSEVAPEIWYILEPSKKREETAPR